MATFQKSLVVDSYISTIDIADQSGTSLVPNNEVWEIHLSFRNIGTPAVGTGILVSFSAGVSGVIIQYAFFYNGTNWETNFSLSSTNFTYNPTPVIVLPPGTYLSKVNTAGSAAKVDMFGTKFKNYQN